MLRNTILTLLMLLTISAAVPAAESINVYPQPKKLVSLGGQIDLPAGKVAIVLGAKATEPEQYAAEMLQRAVRIRYGLQWSVVKESADLKPYTTLVLLGQPSTSSLLKSMAPKLKLDLTEKLPMPDGYLLAVSRAGAKSVAAVAGTNPRSVIFGQDTLFQLIRKNGEKLSMPLVSIKDWPSMLYRGKVNSSPLAYLTPETMDAIALGRQNFIDIRYGNYGTGPDQALDKPEIRQVIKEAHRRGLLVFGTVSLAVQKDEYDKVMAKFQEMIDLGVDGLWPYLGDPGGEGRTGTPLELLNRVLDLGKKHSMTGDLIHYTAGKRGYTQIITNDNFAAAKVPGMADALWFFAVKPTPQSMADAKKLGLKHKYIWWNHWPHPRGGFTSCGNPSQRADGKSNIYADITPFQDAYESPTPQELAAILHYADGAISWGGTIWLQEMVATVSGWLAWAPETNDAEKTRARVYDYLYGPNLVSTAFEFNNLLFALRSKVYVCADDNPNGDLAWPPMLRNEADRPQALDIIARMQAPMQKLHEASRNGSLVDEATMEQFILEPMRAELKAARVIVELPRPEYWWPKSQERILTAVREGNTAQALKWQEDAKKQVETDLGVVHQRLAGLVNVWENDSWLNRFTKLSGTASYTSSPIVLDGQLNEPAWSSAAKLTPFRICNDSETTPTPSTARVLYSDDALYVGLDFEESAMNRIRASLTQRDSAIWDEDSFEIYINTNGLGRPYYQFGANTLGTQSDSMSTVGDADISWNGDWDVKIAKRADGYSAEVRIPYATVGAAKPAKDDMWLVNFGRHDRATEDPGRQADNYRRMSAWGFAPRGQMHDPRKFRPLWFK